MPMAVEIRSKSAFGTIQQILGDLLSLEPIQLVEKVYQSISWLK
jgi:hypothetical protein